MQIVDLFSKNLPLQRQQAIQFGQSLPAFGVQSASVDQFTRQASVSNEQTIPLSFPKLLFGAKELTEEEARTQETARKVKQLYALAAEVDQLDGVTGLLMWDSEISDGIPEAAKEIRGHQINAVDTRSYRLVNSKRLLKLITYLSQPDVLQSLSDKDKAMVRVWKAQYDRYNALPEDYIERENLLVEQNSHLYDKLKLRGDFAGLQQAYKEVFALVREKGQLLAKDGMSPYDALIQIYEPGTTTASLDPMFKALRQEIVPLVQQIQASQAERPQAAAFAFLDRPISAESVEKRLYPFIKVLLEEMGVDFTRTKIKQSVHPSTLDIQAPLDVRMTLRNFEEVKTVADAINMIFNALHEGGHTLHLSKASDGLIFTKLTGSSQGLGESQARLWENQVGRSRAYWEHNFPRLKALLGPELEGVDLDTFYRAINQVQNSKVRTSADEVTYNLHIMLRYELEKRLADPSVDLEKAIATLPATWNQKMRKYLGVKPSNNTEGVLQDKHWAWGQVGYFPTYTLGNVMAAQFIQAAGKAIEEQTGVSLERHVAAGNLKPLTDWLVENVYQHGAIYETPEMLQRATGEGLNAEHFVNYLKKKYGEIYNLPAQPSPN